MIVTRDALVVALRRVGLIASVEEGWFDKLIGEGPTPTGDGLIIQYSADGSTGWSLILDPVTHSFWRWSTDGGVSFSPDGIRFKAEEKPVTPIMDNFGWFNYDNGIKSQVIPTKVWTTLMNDGAGPFTNELYKPAGLTEMLDRSTGKIILSELSNGDEVYIRYVLNVIPKTNNTQYSVSHLFGSGSQIARLPVGRRITLTEGAGVPTQQFLLDSHFFIDNDITRQAGMSPQIFVSNESTVEFTSCYLSITRR